MIILCDNDDGPKEVFKIATKKSGEAVTLTTTDPFYYLGHNYYLVKVPEGTPAVSRDIEDLFPAAVLSTLLEGKPFDKKKEHGDDTAYGKVVFAEKVVRPNAGTIDFSGFDNLLNRIALCLADYAARPIKAVPPVAAAAVGVAAAL